MPVIPRKIVSAQGGVAVANHCAIANSFHIVNLLRHSILSTAGSFGWGYKGCYAFSGLSVYQVPITDFENPTENPKNLLRLFFALNITFVL